MRLPRSTERFRPPHSLGRSPQVPKCRTPTRRNAKRVLSPGQSALQSSYSNSPDIRQIRGWFEASIALLSGLSNGEIALAASKRRSKPRIDHGEPLSGPLQIARRRTSSPVSLASARARRSASSVLINSRRRGDHRQFPLRSLDQLRCGALLLSAACPANCTTSSPDAARSRQRTRLREPNRQPCTLLHRPDASRRRSAHHP